LWLGLWKSNTTENAAFFSSYTPEMSIALFRIQTYVVVNALAEAFAPHGLFIMRSTIAGTRYYHYPELEPDFNNGDRMHLQAEPDNEHDPRAVEVLTRTGHKLGYLPRHQNARIAAWLKRGLPVQATLLNDHQNGWLLQVYVASEAENIALLTVIPR